MTSSIGDRTPTDAAADSAARPELARSASLPAKGVAYTNRQLSALRRVLDWASRMSIYEGLRRPAAHAAH